MELAKAEQHYTSCYCEENVWHLARSLQDRTLQSPDWSAAGAACHVVFVSNRRRMIPLWRQSAHGDEDEPCLWDYHVFCTLSTDTERWVYDLDSTLPFPCRGDAYVRQALRPDIELRDEFQRHYRVVSAEEYEHRFSSDRSHMVKESEYMAAPPPWAPIRGDTAPTAHELPRFWCVEGAEALAAEAPGHLLDDAGFSEWLCGRRPLDGEARAAGPAPGAGADEA